MRFRPLARSAAARVAFPLLTFLTAAAPLACGCDAVAYPSLDIAITDARTGAPAAAGATILVVGPVFKDSVTFGTEQDTNTRHYMAWESEAGAGRYTITVRKPGYQTWTRAGVRVRESGRCDHAQLVALTAALALPP